MKTYLLISFICFNSILYSQITERIVYLDNNGIECEENENPYNKIIVTKVMDDYFVSSKFISSKVSKEWFQLHSYKEIRIDYDSSDFYIKTIYKTCCRESSYSDNKNEIRVITSKEDGFYKIKQYKQDQLIKEGHSKYQYPFLWEGKLISYYDNGVKRSEKVYKNNESLSEKLWTKDSLLIEKTYQLEEIDIEPNFINSTESFSKNLGKHIMKEINYPKEALNAGLMGNVYVSFIITKKGNIECVKVIRGIAPLLDNESIRIIKSIPQLSPGKINNEAVDVVYYIPIKYRRD